jgi:hypothetical protein
MDGLYEILPGTVPVKAAGRSWQISLLDLADYAEMERELLRRRRLSLDVASQVNMDDDEQRKGELTAAAFEEECRGARATALELTVWLQTREGKAFEFWLRLRKTHPEMTLRGADKLLTAAGPAGFRKLATATLLTGENPLGNAPGRAVEPKVPSAAGSFLGVASFAA